jgi:DNA-binding MarR family transcriptional regulator
LPSCTRRNILNVVWTIYLSQTSGGARSERASLEADILDELTSWSPRERHGVFRAWHRHALSLVHLNVLTVLEAEGPLPMKSLAEAMDVSDASVTGIVDRMEKRDLVERRHGTDDRRQVLVHLTDAGRQVFRDMEDHRREIHRRVVAELSDEDLIVVRNGMRAIRAARDRVLSTIDCHAAPDCTEETE